MAEKPKVICLGLGRTGTVSLRDALEMLGFGPAYHMRVILQSGDPSIYDKWRKFADGSGSIALMHELLDNYGSVLDYPPAMWPEKLYAAYPDAKFILTTRDPEKWKKSMEATIIWVTDLISQASAQIFPPIIEGVGRFNREIILEWYHGGRLRTDAPGELVRHNERVKKLIPPEKLLIYEVGEGWDRLVEFLGVPKPEVPFPHVNDTAEFKFRKRAEMFMVGGAPPNQA